MQPLIKKNKVSHEVAQLSVKHLCATRRSHPSVPRKQCAARSHLMANFCAKISEKSNAKRVAASTLCFASLLINQQGGLHKQIAYKWSKIVAASQILFPICFIFFTFTCKFGQFLQKLLRTEVRLLIQILCFFFCWEIGTSYTCCLQGILGSYIAFFSFYWSVVDNLICIAYDQITLKKIY